MLSRGELNQFIHFPYLDCCVFQDLRVFCLALAKHSYVSSIGVRVIDSRGLMPLTPKRKTALRSALLKEWGKLPDMYDTVQFDIHDVSNWEKWTYTILGSEP